MKKVTIWRDRSGNLHIFEGYNRKLSTSGCLATDTKGSEASLFFQFQSDIEAIEETLPADKLDSLNNGYQINAKIDSLYFEL